MQQSSTSCPRDEEGVVEVPLTMHWLWSPLGLLMVLPIPALVGSMLIPEKNYSMLFGQPSFLTEGIRLAAFGYLAIYVVAAAIFVPVSATHRVTIRIDRVASEWLNRSVRTLSFIAFAAYAIWLGNAIIRGLNFSTIVALVSGEEGAMFELRNDYFESFGGITTWMQLGALVIPLAVLRARAGGRRARTLVIGFLLLAAVRALLNSERLALIEVLLSLVLSTLLLRSEAPKFSRGIARPIMLIVGAWLCLLLVFGAFEYFRSWSYAQATFDGGFWEYAGTLLLGYYATAVNLAAFDNYVMAGELYLPKLFQGNVWNSFFGPSPLAGVQQSFGLRTYTNRSGLILPYVASGPVLGALIVVVTAALMVIVARRAASGHVVAFALYCASAVGILELVRIYYLGDSRFLPVLIASVFLSITWTLSRANMRSARDASTRYPLPNRST